MSQLQKLPPFITDAFVLKLLFDLGGKASMRQIHEHMRNTYDTKDTGGVDFPHATQFVQSQLSSLASFGYLDSKRDKRTGEVEIWVKADAKPYAMKIVENKYGSQ
jgi:hypothetical protein